mmetsp:Transcript_39447/g.53570  ORF Transcript_39447/g.53570 Transcript_39447/m.53570 type:complete len:512 (-) Transcript_39447:724-2259(-)
MGSQPSTTRASRKITDEDVMGTMGMMTLPPNTAKVDNCYNFGEVLGTGAFSKVYRVTPKKKNEEASSIPHLAAKKIKKRYLKARDHLALQDEVNILHSCEHPHIIKLVEYFSEKSFYYILTELMVGGELFDRICTKTTYSELEAREVIKILLDILAYLHSHHIAHRDLKPENLLLMSVDDDMSIKLADFGLATYCKDQKLTQNCGTPDYVAPEIIDFDATYDWKCDIWSAGIIAYILLGGYPPFQSTNDDRDELFKLILEGRYVFHKTYWEDVSVEAKDLISSMLIVDPKHRPSAQELLRHPWIQAADENLQGKVIDSSLQRFKYFNAKRKLRAAVYTLIAACRIRSAFFDSDKFEIPQDSNGNWTEEQIAEIREAFSNFDEDGDGSITADELMIVLDKLFGNSFKPNERAVKAMIRKVDKDGNGEIEFDEFLRVMAVNDTESKDWDKDVEEAFEIIDTDGDGTISFDELRYMLTNIDDIMSDDEFTAMFELVDVNGDKEIDMDEFKQLMS